MIVRMEHTEGRGGPADVWVDGTLLRACDYLSPPDRRTPPGPLEEVTFRYVNDAGTDWHRAVRENPHKRITLEPVSGTAYVGWGRVQSVMPVVVHFGLLVMPDPTWSTDESLVGQFVRIEMDRLELLPAETEDAP
jgi:hypothetical protein